MSYLNQFDLLASEQSGFRPRHSTQTSLIRLVNQLQMNTDRGETSSAMFVDTSKAFDSVSHERLLLKLKLLGVEGTELSWFESYLTGRLQTVRVGTTTSPFLQLKSGVPQGSILGPLLFLVYINDLPSAIGSAMVNLYADDTVVYGSDSGCANLQQKINAAMDELTNWFRLNRLQLNTKKTVAILFGKKNSAGKL
jgi:hypothetical protein